MEQSSIHKKQRLFDFGRHNGVLYFFSSYARYHPEKQMASVVFENTNKIAVSSDYEMTMNTGSVFTASKNQIGKKSTARITSGRFDGTAGN